jgi:hypothetical protein
VSFLPDQFEMGVQPSIDLTPEGLQPEAIDLTPEGKEQEALADRLGIPKEMTLERMLADVEENNNIFGTAEATKLFKTLNANTPKHEKAKHREERRLFTVLQIHPKLKYLAVVITDPAHEILNEKIERFYVELRGPKTEVKRRMLNYCLMVLSQTLCLKAFDGTVFENMDDFCEAQMEPNTVLQKFKYLFTTMREKGIMYSQTRDFNFDGMLFLFDTDLFVVCWHPD